MFLRKASSSPSPACPLQRAALKPGDGIVFDEGHPEQDEQGGRILRVTPRGRHTVELEFHRGDINLSALSVGAIVWKTDDPAIRKRLEHSFSRDLIVRRTPLDAFVTARVGQPLRLILTAGDHSVEVQSDQPLQPAQKFPATDDLLRDQLARLGDTPFELRSLATDIAGGPMVPKSVLNELRRHAVAELLHRREHAHAIERPNALDELRAWTRSPRHGERGERRGSAEPRLLAEIPEQSTAAPALHLLVRTIDQLEAALALDPGHRPASIYCDFEDVRRYPQAVARCNAAAMPVALATMRIVKPGEDGWLRQILDARPDAILVRNLASIAFYRDAAPELPLIGDYALNIANELTAALFAEQNLARMVPGYDLNWRQLAAMLSRSDPSRFEAVIHQHMPMFHMEHCPFSHLLSNGKNFRDCGRPCERHTIDLRDRVGQPHPLIPDAGCRNTLFNAQAQSAAEYMRQMRQLGITHFRIELLRERAHEVAPLLKQYADGLSARTQPRATIRSLRVLSSWA